MVENIELEVMVNKADSGSLKTEFTPTDTDNYNTVENMELKGMDEEGGWRQHQNGAS